MGFVLVRSNQYDSARLFVEGTWVEPWDVTGSGNDLSYEGIPVEIIDSNREGWIKIKFKAEGKE